MNEYTLQDISVGMKVSFEKEMTAEMEEAFRTITGDINPLHQDDAYAQEIGNGRFRSHVSFGMLTASFYSTLAGVYMPGKYSLIHSLEELKFLAPVYVGDILTISAEVTEVETELGLLCVKAQIRNQDNKCVSKAKMKIIVMK